MDSHSKDRLVEEMLSYLEPPMPTADKDANSTVAKFYENRSVFITGATGFIGKVSSKDQDDFGFGK